MKRIGSLSVAVFVLVGLFTLAYASDQGTTGWTSLSSQEASRMLGTVGPFQKCGILTNCPGRCVCSGVTCTQTYTQGIPFCEQSGGTNQPGCTSGGVFLDCYWA